MRKSRRQKEKHRIACSIRCFFYYLCEMKFQL